MVRADIMLDDNRLRQCDYIVKNSVKDISSYVETKVPRGQLWDKEKHNRQNMRSQKHWRLKRFVSLS